MVIRSAEELLSWVQQIGFLPLFSNQIRGFSIEEHTKASDWWSDNPASDPWVWRQILASDESVAYGKFFDSKAGFVSRSWFPALANFRRDGYDYEGMYEDGKLKQKAKQIMDALEPDENMRSGKMLSSDLHRASAVVKGFETTLTSLQMQSFLIINDFKQKRNKSGIPYGWHVAEITTPETKWGYEEVNGARESTEESRNRIYKQVQRFYPDASNILLDKVLGIRR